MTASLTLPVDSVREITGILARHPAVERAVLFGSRAKGVHRPGSDIDLALIGGADLDTLTLGQIEEALDDSYLPYRFSLLILTRQTDPEVAAHIARVGRTFYEIAQGSVATPDALLNSSGRPTASTRG